MIDKEIAKELEGIKAGLENHEARLNMLENYPRQKEEILIEKPMSKSELQSFKAETRYLINKLIERVNSISKKDVL